MPKPVPRIRKHKARARAGQAKPRFGSSKVIEDEAHNDSNASIVIPASAAEKEDRRNRLREELRATKPESTISSQKRKRLDRYIDTKLRQDENSDLIKKLEAQAKNAHVGQLRSSRNLGQRAHKKKRKLSTDTVDESDTSLAKSDVIVAFEPETVSPNGGSRDAVAVDSQVQTIRDQDHNSNISNFGTGLRTPIEVDYTGKPVIKRRKRIRPAVVAGGLSDFAPEENREGYRSEYSPNGGQNRPTLVNSESGAFHGQSSDSDLSNRSDSPSTSEEALEDHSDEGEESLDDDWSDQRVGRSSRASAFKAWATQQRNDAVGFRPSSLAEADLGPKKALDKLASDKEEPNQTRALDFELVNKRHGLDASSTKDLSKSLHGSGQRLHQATTVFNVPVERSAEVQEARLALPVVAEEQKIMESISSNDCTVIWGQTGSGKTTQVPQFLYEAGYGTSESPNPGMIGVTQPRRVAAVSMAKRVAMEMGDSSGKVSFQIRFDSTVSSKTAIKFMTDGVLLREITQDFTLSKYSAIVIDEAHERSVNTDILVGMLSRIVETRRDLSQRSLKYKPLKLVIMSATLRINEITSNKVLFRRNLPNLVQAEGRQYPVTIHFARKTHRDYVEEAFRKVSRGHKKLPPGGMLVFLTGQSEINLLARRLRQTFASTEKREVHYPLVRYSPATAMLEDGDLELSRDVEENEIDSDSESELWGLDNDKDDDDFGVADGTLESLKVHVLPLYSQLPAEQQMQVFETPPKGSRMIILATNVAETSLTIPGIRYVFDCGRAKEKHSDVSTGIQSFEVGWISKASASQRTGRAGRTGPGHCYRLYSSAVFESDFPEFSEPEIKRSQIEGVVLQLKSLGIPKVSNFPFPTPPTTSSLVEAEKMLEHLGAISNGAVTSLGEELSLYPLSPRLSRIILQGLANGCQEHALTLVSALAMHDIFLPENQLDHWDSDKLDESEGKNEDSLAQEQRRKDYKSFHSHLARLDRTSDALKFLTVLCDWTSANKGEPGANKIRGFANTKALNESIRLRQQLAAVVETRRPGSVDVKALPQAPAKKQVGHLRKVIAAGYIDQIAVRADLSPTPPTSLRKPKRATDVPYMTLFPSNTHTFSGQASTEVEQEKYVFIHPSSVLAQTTKLDNLPQYIIYSKLSKATPTSATLPQGNVRLPKTRLHPLTPILPSDIISLAASTSLLEEGKPLGKIEPVNRADYEDGKERRVCWTTPFLVGQSGSLGWPLPPARKVLQVRDGRGKGWAIEKVLDQRAK